MKELTIGELIEKLSKLDANAIISVEDPDGYAFPIQILEREQAYVIKGVINAYETSS